MTYSHKSIVRSLTVCVCVCVWVCKYVHCVCSVFLSLASQRNDYWHGADELLMVLQCDIAQKWREAWLGPHSKQLQSTTSTSVTLYVSTSIYHLVHLYLYLKSTQSKSIFIIYIYIYLLPSRSIFTIKDIFLDGTTTIRIVQQMQWKSSKFFGK